MKKQIRKSSKKKALVLTPGLIIRATGLVIIGILIVIAILTAFNYFAVDGPSVQQGAKAAQPVINALEKYKKDHSAYPPALSALVPAYLPSLPSAAPHYPFNYESCSDSSGYRLSFKLGMDAINYCASTSTSGAAGWTCSSAVSFSCTAP
jgi:hypothetical protein